MSLAERFDVCQQSIHAPHFRLDESYLSSGICPAYTSGPTLRHIAAMANVVPIDTIRGNLRRLMAEKGIKPTTLSQRVGTSKTLVKDLLEKTNDVSLSTLTKLADALGVNAGSLLDPGMATVLGQRLFVKGEVAAGVWVEAVEWPESQWQAFHGMPGIVADLEHRFGLRVIGDSMDLVYPQGSIVECVSAFGHTEIYPGRRVVIVRKNYSGDCEATVKELVERDGSMWAVPRSTNPAHRSFKLDEAEDGIEETRIAAIVVASVRPE